MSLEKDFIMLETHTKPVTAMGCSQARREIYLGFEDGLVKAIDIDTKKHVQTYWEHKGWITGFLYWSNAKLLFCSSNDAVVSIIGPGGILVDKVYIGQPIYSMALNNRRKEIIFGISNGLQFHQIFETKDSFSHYIEAQPICIVREHTDIVRCVASLDSRVYSAGYDGAFVIYDCQFTGNESVVKYLKNRRAHDAGISCLSVEKDPFEKNIWVLTGGFDKCLKIWTGDGKIIHKFEGFLTGVTGLSYLPKNKTVCCVAGSNITFIYDPKSGEELTDFIATFREETEGNQCLHLLKYLSDFNIMLATTNRKQLIVYKYNPNGSITSLKYKHTIDSICYTSKFPILIFTGDSNGNVLKWEQRQSNHLVYNSEQLLKSDKVIKESSSTQGQFKARNKSSFLMGKNDKLISKRTNVVLKLVFVESMDLILAACEDASIYVWGFDEEGVKILKNMKYIDSEKSDETTFKYFEGYLKRYMGNRDMENMVIGLDEENKKKPEPNCDSVTNRVAGLMLKKVLSEHTSCVTSLVVVDRLDLYSSRYLLSSGWDRRICIWDLEKLRLFDLFRNKNVNELEEVELASDGNILDMCYNEKSNLFAYASTDSVCYIRKFSTHGSEMMLVDTLQGHVSEVNCIRWNPSNCQWVTGGEDGSVRIWVKIVFIKIKFKFNAMIENYSPNGLIVYN